MRSDIYKIEVQEPIHCERCELQQFEGLVRLGDEVVTAGLTNRIANSFRLAWVKYGTEIVGVASLKKPNKTYHDSVFQKSGTTESPRKWEAELGWIFVSQTHRRNGLARKLIDALLAVEPHRSIFATSREKNDPILPLLKEFGFTKEGDPYASSKGAYNLLLHLKTGSRCLEK